MTFPKRKASSSHQGYTYGKITKWIEPTQVKTYNAESGKLIDLNPFNTISNLDHTYNIIKNKSNNHASNYNASKKEKVKRKLFKGGSGPHTLKGDITSDHSQVNLPRLSFWDLVLITPTPNCLNPNHLHSIKDNPRGSPPPPTLRILPWYPLSLHILVRETPLTIGTIITLKNLTWQRWSCQLTPPCY